MSAADDAAPLAAAEVAIAVRRSCRLSGSRSCGFRRPGFDRAAVARGALAQGATTRPEARRGHRRSRPAAGGEARSRGGEAAGALARRRAPHAALDRPQAHERAAGGRARGALSPARGGSARGRRAVTSLTAHTLDDQAETVLIRLAARQRDRRACRHGAGVAASRRRGGGHRAGPPAVAHSEGPAARHLARAGVGYADDPTNRDPRFARAAVARADAGAGARGPHGRSGWRGWRAGARRAEAAWRRRSAPLRPALAPGDWPAGGPVDICGWRVLQLAGRSGAAPARPRD